MEKGDALLNRGYYKTEFNRNGDQFKYIKKSNCHCDHCFKGFVSCWMMIYENCLSFWVDF